MGYKGPAFKCLMTRLGIAWGTTPLGICWEEKSTYMEGLGLGIGDQESGLLSSLLLSLHLWLSCSMFVPADPVRWGAGSGLIPG